MEFKNLEFSPHGTWSGIKAKAFFPNGYGVSVIKANHSYGGDRGLYELAVLDGNEKSWRLTYDTPITDDVEGNLSEADVTDLMQKVAMLKERERQS